MSTAHELGSLSPGLVRLLERAEAVSGRSGESEVRIGDLLLALVERMIEDRRPGTDLLQQFRSKEIEYLTELSRRRT